jgi:hypothetical protein
MVLDLIEFLEMKEIGFKIARKRLKNRKKKCTNTKKKHTKYYTSQNQKVESQECGIIQ